MKEALQKLLNQLVQFTSKDYQLDHNARGWRLTLKNGNVNVSPRLSANKMIVYLNAFVEGVHYGVKQARELR